MHARPASASAVPRARGHRPHAGPVTTGHGQATGNFPALGQAPSPARDHGREIPMTATVRSLELAGLRRGWGETYRITWGNGRFHATHIVSGQALDARSATELRRLLRHHHVQRDATSWPWPGTGNPATASTPGAPRYHQHSHRPGG